jgi:hypothetical protein
MRSNRVWMRSIRMWMRSNRVWMRYTMSADLVDEILASELLERLTVNAKVTNSPGCNPIILRHS